VSQDLVLSTKEKVILSVFLSCRIAVATWSPMNPSSTCARQDTAFACTPTRTGEGQTAGAALWFTGRTAKGTARHDPTAYRSVGTLRTSECAVQRAFKPATRTRRQRRSVWCSDNRNAASRSPSPPADAVLPPHVDGDCWLLRASGNRSDWKPSSAVAVRTRGRLGVSPKACTWR